MNPNQVQITQGQTLSGLASQYGTTVDAFMQANANNPSAVPDANNPDLILAGGYLNIPGQQSNNLITTSTQAQNENTQYSADLQSWLNNYSNVGGQGDQQSGEVDMSNYSDPMTQLLDRQMRTSDTATQQLISRIQAKRQQSANDLKAQTDMYKRGLQVLGLQGTGAQATPDLLQGQILAVQQQTQKRLDQLDQEESFAILDAQTAKDDNDIQLLKEKMNYLKDIKKEKQDALKRMYEQMTYQTGISDIKGAEIYDKLGDLSPEDQSKALEEIAKQYGIPIGSLMASVARAKEEQTNRELDLAIKKKSLVGGGGTSAEKSLTLSKIKEYKEKFPEIADQITAGMTESDVQALLKNVSTESNNYSATYMKNNYSTGKLFKLAKSDLGTQLGVTRKRNLSRQGEIDQFLSVIDGYISFLREQGLSEEEITADIESYL